MPNSLEWQSFYSNFLNPQVDTSRSFSLPFLTPQGAMVSRNGWQNPDTSGRETVYHVMSRTALDGFVTGDVEKDYLLRVIKGLSVPYFAVQ